MCSTDFIASDCTRPKSSQEALLQDLGDTTVPVVARIQFRASHELRFLFFCWLLAGSCSQLLEVIHNLWLMALTMIEASNGRLSLYYA